MMPVKRYAAALLMSTFLFAELACAIEEAPKKLPIIPAAASVARVGQKAPDFSLTDIDGKRRTLQEFLSTGKTVVLFWFDPECQVVSRHFKIQQTFPDLYTKYHGRKVAFVAVNSADSGRALFASKADFIKAWRAHSPILIDSTGAVGKIYGAKSSPQVFIIGSDGIVRYSGAVDNDPKGGKVGQKSINYVTKALDELLAGQRVTEAETKPYGCRIKYAR